MLKHFKFLLQRLLVFIVCFSSKAWCLVTEGSSWQQEDLHPNSHSFVNSPDPDWSLHWLLPHLADAGPTDFPSDSTMLFSVPYCGAHGCIPEWKIRHTSNQILQMDCTATGQHCILHSSALLEIIPRSVVFQRKAELRWCCLCYLEIDPPQQCGQCCIYGTPRNAGSSRGWLWCHRKAWE